MTRHSFDGDVGLKKRCMSSRGATEAAGKLSASFSFCQLFYPEAVETIFTLYIAIILHSYSIPSKAGLSRERSSPSFFWRNVAGQRTTESRGRLHPLCIIIKVGKIA